MSIRSASLPISSSTLEVQPSLDVEKATNGLIVDPVIPSENVHPASVGKEIGDPETSVEFLVGWEENDPANPQNWSDSRKWIGKQTISLADHNC